MEKEKFLSSESIWSSCSFGMEMQPSELNSGTEQLPNCFLNPNWENSMDQSDPFESALSSMVSSPVASNGGAVPACGGGVGDSVMIRELIGRIGSIWGSDETSPQSYIIKGNNNGSTNTSCYRNPLGSPPELILSRMDSQIRGNLPNPGNQLPNHPSLAQFAADPGFAERAARFSCFSSRNFEGLNGQLGLNDPIGLPHRLMPRIESAKLSKVSSNQSMKVAGSQVNAQESNKSSPQDADSGSDKKTSNVMRPSMPETVELGDSRENSSLSEQILGGELSVKGQNDANSRKRKSIPKGKAKETSSPSASDAKVGTDNDESSAKRSKQEATTGNENEAAKAKAESNGKARNGTDGNPKQSKENAKPPEPPKDYIHVRARRGQATDSHSLAERVRREKISERMKFLQDLVPGCNKVTGKAVMLDEIINYVQSLQRQVEFLSMKLATVNPRMDFNVDALLSKAMFQSRGSSPQSIYPVDASTPGLPYGYQPRQGLPVSSDISNSGETQFSMNPLNAALRRNPSIQLPALDGFSEAAPQASMFWEDDLQSIVQMGFGQNQLPSIHGPMAAGQMKVEL